MDDGLLEGLADLAVGVGANVQPDQVVGVQADLDQCELARVVAAAAYRRGARFVDVNYFDPYVKRARIELAAEDTLGYVPPWLGERLLALGRDQGSNISLTGASAPAALAGLDPTRAGRDQLPFLRESMTVINERSVNWTVVPGPSEDWARIVYPDLDGQTAVDHLSRAIRRICRLDEPDPVAAWEERGVSLTAAAERLNRLGLDSVRFEGPGTDLTIGLFSASRWCAAVFTTAGGIRHLPNIPTEEVFTAPDPRRAEGKVRSTRPLVLMDGSVIRGLEVRFEAGRAVSIEAEEGAEVLRGRATMDEGAARLGEVALVDRESRIGSLGTVFSNTLLDENAASHIALGSGLAWAVGDADRARMNQSAIHIDFMIGADDVVVTGVTRSGGHIPLLRDGEWQV